MEDFMGLLLLRPQYRIQRQFQDRQRPELEPEKVSELRLHNAVQTQFL
jgi:hypothetical protein